MALGKNSPIYISAMQTDDHWLYPDKTPQMAQSLNTSVWNEQNDSKSMLKSWESFNFTIILLHICKIENTLTLYKCLSLKVTHNLALYKSNLLITLTKHTHTYSFTHTHLSHSHFHDVSTFLLLPFTSTL